MKSTQSTTYRSLNTELNRINSSLESLRNQAATGKKLLRPSDDPAAIRPVLSARTQIRATDRFISSLSTAADRLANQDSYLDQAENLLVSAKETAINAINGAMSDADLTTLADKIGYLKTQMLSVANAQVGGQYIFAGFKEDTAPFIENGDTVSYQGDSNMKTLESSPGEYVQTNLDGAKLFMGMSDSDGDGVLEQTGMNVFEVLTNLERAIRGESGDVYNGNNALPADGIDYRRDASGDIAVDANGNYTPIAVDGSGNPVLDGSGNDVPLTYAGAPINLHAATDTNGKVLTIEEYNLLNPPGVVTAFDGITALDTTQPMYFHSDGTAVADFNAAGEPVLTYEQSAGPPVVTAAIPLLNSDGSPVQMTVVPTLDEMLSTLETTADKTRSARGLMGNNAERIETSKGHLEGVLVDLAQILSRYEDVDIIDVITEITQTETALEAALNVTGKVSKLSIMDYI